MEWQCLWLANYTALPLHKINPYGCLNRILLLKISFLSLPASIILELILAFFAKLGKTRWGYVALGRIRRG
jgi:hypothetical protein